MSPVSDPVPGRDAYRDAIGRAARHFDLRFKGAQVRMRRPISLRHWSVTEGIEIRHQSARTFEAVRTRRLFSRQWAEIQSVQEAASKVGAFLHVHAEDRHLKKRGSAR